MERRNNFDLLRLMAAVSVIFSHAFLLAENSQDHDPLMIATGGQTILGLVGVFIFFTISGYLITQSFDTSRTPLIFLAKRALRIFPGLVVCLFVCVFVVGPLTTTLPLSEYFALPQPYLFLAHNAVLDVVFNRLPGVVFGPGNAGGIVNGPLWSLPCEALLYLLLCGLGMLRLLTLPVGLVLLALGMICLWVDTSGDTPGGTGWLLGFFAAGICCYRLRGPRLAEPRLALLALAGLILGAALHAFVVAFPICGGYLTIFAATYPRFRALPAARFGDLSYGLYIYGWPVEQCIVYFAGPGVRWWEVFGAALAVTLAIAWLSWHGVEKRFRLSALIGRRAVRVEAEVAAGS